MNLTKSHKILVGIATLWVTLYPVIFFIAWLFIFFGTFMFPFVLESPDVLPEIYLLMMLPFMAIFPLHFCTIFILIALVVFYLIHVIKNTQADETVRIILGIGNFFLPFIAMPIYFFIFIWQESPPAWAMAKEKTT